MLFLNDNGIDIPYEPYPYKYSGLFEPNINLSFLYINETGIFSPSLESAYNLSTLYSFGLNP